MRIVILSERNESKDLSSNVNYLLDLEIPTRVPKMSQIYPLQPPASKRLIGDLTKSNEVV